MGSYLVHSYKKAMSPFGPCVVHRGGRSAKQKADLVHANSSCREMGSMLDVLEFIASFKVKQG